MNKLVKKIVTVALALTMIMGTVLSVAAVPGDPGHQAGAAIIKKVLKVPVGGTKPAENFNFTFTAKGYTSDATGDLIATTTGMPAISVQTIATTPASTPIVGGYQIFEGSVDAFLADSITGTNFPHAGVWVYEVAETPPGTPTGNMNYSQARYMMYVYVTNNAALDSLEINDVGFRITALNGANIDPAGTTLPTVTANPQTGTSSTAGKADPIFTNRYTPPADLEITKTVAGEFADTIKLFTYTLEIERPQAAADIDGAQTYTGTIYKGAVDTGRTVVVTFAAGDTTGVVTGTTFQLAHGEKLDFLRDDKEPEVGVRTGLPMGSEWRLTETGEARYSASATYDSNGVTGSVGPTAVEGNIPLTLPSATTYLTLGNAVNSAAWTNTHLAVTPTGILMNNLPFILLIVVSIGGFVAYIANKRRKATN